MRPKMRAGRRLTRTQLKNGPQVHKQKYISKGESLDIAFTCKPLNRKKSIKVKF